MLKGLAGLPTLIREGFECDSFPPQIQLSVSTSALSDGFSLDTVGSYGCVRCPASTLDYLVTPCTPSH